MPSTPAHAHPAASEWVQRWSHLAAPGCSVLDIACGHGRHMRWFQERGHRVMGIDRDAVALKSAAAWGQVLQADLEGGPWPLQSGGTAPTFGTVVVTNYLWRALWPQILASVAPGGLLVYETFAAGNEAFGKPSRPDFLLRAGELLDWCGPHSGLQVVAYESGVVANPLRCMQRIAAVRSQSVATLQRS